jgi:hypothetical protein
MQSFMNKIRLCIYFVCGVFAVSASAYAPSEGNVSASLGALVYRTNFGGNGSSLQSPVMGDFGFIVNGDLNDHGSLEIAIFHMNKMYFRDLGGQFVSEQTEMIQVDMGYRRWLNSQLSTGVTFFSTYSIGDPKSIHNDFTPANVLDTSARDNTEYGLDLSIQAEIWAKEKTAVTLDARYALSVTSRPNERGDHYGIFLAYRYLVQEKINRPTPGN